ncbi:Brix domain-containing protein [Cubamyces menziesii]|nr:Brix domain-containing protein [Cubamyces menziesii]
MARRRKHRTHLKGGVASNPGSAEGVPKSFVIKHGQVGSSLAQLVRDVRKVMEPNTASRLRGCVGLLGLQVKERARNKLRDFLTMAPALGVTHLLAFTLTDVAPSLRIVRLSAGPTLSFRVERYSLTKDIINASRRARSMSTVEYLSPPLLVLASFPPPSPTTPPHLTLLMKTFQSMFPPLSPHTLSLSSARRVVLIHYNADRGTVDFRHYLITVKPYGVSKRIRRILEGAPAKSSAHSHTGTLDLGNEKDVADFLLRKKGEPGPSSDGYESAASSASSVAGDDADAVSLADDYVGRNNKKGTKRAVKLDEIGPRMELRLIKIVEGVPGKEGGVLYHEFVKKTKAEIRAQKAEHAAKEKLRQQRREEQEKNVQRKKMAQEAKKKGKMAGEKDDDDAVSEDESEGGSDLDEEMGSAEEEEFSEGEGGDDEGAWDEDEMISEGEESEEESGSESEDEAPRPPPKKLKTKSKR